MEKTLHCYCAEYNNEKGFKIYIYQINAKETLKNYITTNKFKKFPDLTLKYSKENIDKVIHAKHGFYNYYIVSDKEYNYNSFLLTVKDRLTEQIYKLKKDINILEKATNNLLEIKEFTCF